MKLFKPRSTPAGPARRFHTDAEFFTMRQEKDVYVAEVRAEAERAVDLFHALTGQMPQLVDLSLDCLRSGRRYVGEGLQLAEVTETVARLKVPLIASGGVELSVYTNEEQLSLSSMLDLWIYAKSDRWLYLLLGRGLEESESLAARRWFVKPEEFTGAPELVDAVTSTAERLTLRLL